MKDLKGKTPIDPEWAVRLLPVADKVHSLRGLMGASWEYRDVMEAIEEADNLWVAAPESMAARMGHHLIVEESDGRRIAFATRHEMVERAVEEFAEHESRTQ